MTNDEVEENSDNDKDNEEVKHCSWSKVKPLLHLYPWSCFKIKQYSVVQGKAGFWRGPRVQIGIE